MARVGFVQMALAHCLFASPMVAGQGRAIFFLFFFCFEGTAICACLN